MEYVTAERLGAVLKGRGLELVFLCSCKTGVTGARSFSGVAQQLMAMQGGGLPCVVATQANLPVAESEVLVKRFFQLLGDAYQPSQALAKARSDAFSGVGGAWSVPIMLTRPARAEVFASEAFVKGLPPKKLTYQSREAERDGLQALKKGRLVMLVGLPGIGKTETGKEIARLALQEGMFDRVIYQEIAPDLLRAMLAAALGQTDIKDDYILAAILDGQRQQILIVLDNAEDLMKDFPSEARFREQVNILLGHTKALKILLTTRWVLSGTDIPVRKIELPPMSDGEMSCLLAAEIDEMGVLQEEWIESESWQALIKLLDGHPRSLWLTAHHFQTRSGADPAFVLSRLRGYREKAIVDPGLFGRRDVFEALKHDQKARLKSLVASMDFSFEVLEAQFPDAAEVYLVLSLFPSGLPESVAMVVAGGTENASALDQIYRFHLAAWNKVRIYYPIPLQWYSETRRRERGVDEEKFMRRAIEAFTEYIESCDERLTSGSIIAGLDMLLIEETTLQWLFEWIGTHGDHGDGICFSGRIATAAANGFLFADRMEALVNLLNRGLAQTQKMKDYRGEANCLQSLGDLKMRSSDLEGAGQAYEDALPIFCEIRDRLGEANCLQSQGNLELVQGNPVGAFLLYRVVLETYTHVRHLLGYQSVFGYMARAAHAASAHDQALLLAEKSLEIGRSINDRYGQTINLNTQLIIWGALSEFAPFGATVILLKELEDDLGNQAAAQTYSNLLEQLKSGISEKTWNFFSENPEAVRRDFIKKAAERFEKNRRDLLDPPVID